MKIKSTKQAYPFVKLLVYSRAGFGKTELCATAPKPLIINTDKGLLTLSDRNLPYVDVDNLDELDNVYNWLVSDTKEKEKFETICLDGITEVGEIALAQAKEDYSDNRQAYGELADVVSKRLRRFRDLKGFHVYFTAKQSRVVDESIGVTSYMAMMPGKTLLYNLSYYFDEVLALHVEEDKTRWLQSQPDNRFEAKDRSGMLPDKCPPDLMKIFKRIQMKGKS